MSPRTIFGMAGPAFQWILRLAPAAAFFSLFFVLDGGLRWLGLFGIVPLILALRADTLRCGPRGCRIGGEQAPRNWPAP